MDAQLNMASTVALRQGAAQLEYPFSLPSQAAGGAARRKPSRRRRGPATSGWRRLRQGRACETCHSRKVRCDASSLGMPCTNCAAFSLECTIPTKYGSQIAETGKDLLRDQGERSIPIAPLPEGSLRRSSAKAQLGIMSGSFQGIHTASLSEPKLEEQPEDNKYYAKLIKVEATEAPIKEAGKVVYLDESSNLSLLMNDYKSAAGIVHYPMHGSAELGYSASTKMDPVELNILRRRGALTLPPRTVSDDLIKTYFKWVAPVMPIVDKARFMQQYRDPDNPPSLLLLQAIFLAGCRACTNAQLMDASGSTIPAATVFYNRAKALYEAGYESDRIAIVQALILMGWYWEEPGKVTKNVFYWNGLAVTIAQGFGMHRNSEGSRLSVTDKRLWKRIWWTLFTRDRSVAVALGRPAHINMIDSDVEMLTEDDFIDGDDSQRASLLSGWLQVQFFLQYVKLCKVMDLVLFQNYSIASKARRQHALVLIQCDIALGEWLQGCPQELRWEQPRHNFWSAVLFSTFHTTCCLLHRKYLSESPSQREALHDIQTDSLVFLSRNPALQAAQAITSIMETLSHRNELQFSPPFLVYSVSSALLIHVYQLHVAMPVSDVATQCRIRVCLAVLEQISKVWLVAKMIQSLYEHVLSEKGLGDFLKNDPGEIYNISRPLMSKKASNMAPHKNGNTATESSEKSSEDPALTSALLAHLFAALKSGTSSNNSEAGDAPGDGLESNNITCHQPSSYLTGLPREDLCNLCPDTRSVPQLSHQSMGRPESAQFFATHAPAVTHVPQYMPQDNVMRHNLNIFTDSQAVAIENFSTQSPQLLQDQSFVQNSVDGPQYFHSTFGEFQYNWPTTGVGYNVAGTDSIPIDTSISHHPDLTQPNSLEWVQYFGIGSYQ